MSKNLLCEKTSNGTPCNSCHFKAMLQDCQNWANELRGSFTNKNELLTKIERAELRFDDAVELIADKQHKVTPSFKTKYMTNYFSRKVTTGPEWRTWQ